MIEEMKALSIVETEEVARSMEEKQEILTFLKKFTKLNVKKAGELRKELENLEMLKIKDVHIAKIIDLLPDDVSDLNKIFVDVSLDENEINKLLEVIKKYS